MKKTGQRLLLVSLAMALLCGAVSALIVPASAATQQQAVDWLLSRHNIQSAAPLGGGTNTTCTALVQRYYEYLGSGLVFSYASPPSGWASISASSQAPQVGDVLVWGTAHVGIVVEISGGTVYTMEQNNAATNVCCGSSDAIRTHKFGINMSGVTKYYRPPLETYVTDGNFISYNNNIYRIVGGAPLYVSNWNNVGGVQSTTTVSAEQFNSLNQYPADGTLVVTTQGQGEIFRFAGGAPIYVSNWQNIGGVQPAILVDHVALNPPYVRQYPIDGTLVNAQGKIYVFAGGAPLYVNTWDAVGGEKPSARVDHVALNPPSASSPWNHVRQYPADGTLISGHASGRMFRVAEGHPYHISSWDLLPAGTPRIPVQVDDWVLDNHNEHLNHNPHGDFNAASGGNGTITVRGWAWDGNAISQSIQVQVYIGGPSGGGGTLVATLTANKSRPDVNTTYPGVGNNHGFEETITTTRRGQQSIYVYALNVGAGNANPLLMNSPKTVTITEPPVLTYALTVVNGSGSGNYAAGATVNISANAAPAGKVFDKWTATAGTLANANNASTTFTMPASAATVTATYKDVPPETTQPTTTTATTTTTSSTTTTAPTTTTTQVTTTMPATTTTALATTTTNPTTTKTTTTITTTEPTTITTAATTTTTTTTLTTTTAATTSTTAAATTTLPPPTSPNIKYIFSTKYPATFLNWILFFVCFGWLWMWF